jgi:hypothetical protein
MHGNPWYFVSDTPHWNPPANEALSYLTDLFENPLSALENYADSQISQGLTYLVDTTASGDSGWFNSRAVTVLERLQAISVIYALFDKLFRPRCAPILLHVDEEGAKPLNRNCYMWWDSFASVALPDDPSRLARHDAVLAVMEKTLTLDSIACQESALHGLGHWQPNHPRPVESIIDRFLQSHTSLDHRIVAYAQAARSGCVL